LKVLVLGDTHAGSDAGLTHPDYITPEREYAQRPFWDWWQAEIEAVGPVDLALHGGDAVDGEGKKDRLGIIEPNTKKQADMSLAALSIIRADAWRMVYGTPYHVTGTYDYEEPVAERLHATIKDEQRIRIGDALISDRHVVGRSDTAYGQGTLLFKEVVREIMASIQNDDDDADLIIRHHVHYFFRTDNAKKTAIICPALQLPGSVYGRKMKAMFYDVGFLVLHFEPGLHIEKHIMPLRVAYKREVETFG